MSEVFGVTLERYRHDIDLPRSGKPYTETNRDRDGFIHIPSELSEIIVGVFGLDNRTITKHNSSDPPNTTTLTVLQVSKLYNYPTNSAVGQTIGIFSLSGYDVHDIKLYFAGLPAGYMMPKINDILVHGTNSGHDPCGETTQDICIAASFAPGAAISVYVTTGDQQGWIDLINRVAHLDAGDAHCSVLLKH
jgi:kumamolisin